jgi:hypothetical protein
MAGGDHLRIEQKPSGRAIARPDSVGRPYREAIDAGTVEGRHVSFSDEVGREYPSERLRNPNRLGRKRRLINRAFKASARLLGQDDLEKLLLAQLRPAPPPSGRCSDATRRDLPS